MKIVIQNIKNDISYIFGRYLVHILVIKKDLTELYKTFKKKVLEY